MPVSVNVIVAEHGVVNESNLVFREKIYFLQTYYNGRVEYGNEVLQFVEALVVTVKIPLKTDGSH